MPEAADGGLIRCRSNAEVHAHESPQRNQRLRAIASLLN
jgi:hypothetical protein